MNQSVLEKLALFVSIGVIAAAVWFWTLQIGDVIEMLRLAYG